MGDPLHPQATISTSVVKGGVLFSSAACREVDLAAMSNHPSMPGHGLLLNSGSLEGDMVRGGPVDERRVGQGMECR